MNFVIYIIIINVLIVTLSHSITYSVSLIHKALVVTTKLTVAQLSISSI